MMKKFVILSLLIVVVIVSIFLLDSLNNVDIESDLVKNLYTYLGDEDINHCGGLNVYKTDAVTIDSISIENRLCKAYYAVIDKETKIANKTGKNDNKVDICKVGDITFTTTDEAQTVCSYVAIKADELNESYKNIYGQDIDEDFEDPFYITTTQACYLEGEEYLCGEAETFSYLLTSPSAVYRLIVKATSSKNSLNIIDYYLKIADNKCYLANDATSDSTSCSEAIANGATIDKDFVKKYGAKYIHTFKKQNDSYYWYKSSK